MHDRALSGRARISPPPSAQLASSDAGATSRLGCRGALRQQQRQHLDRLAEPHVVGEAGTKAAAPTATAASARRRADTAAACHAATDRICVRRRRVSAAFAACPQAKGRRSRCDQSATADVAWFVGDRGARQHAHRRGEGQALTLRQLFGFAELLRSSAPAVRDRSRPTGRAAAPASRCRRAMPRSPSRSVSRRPA